MAFRPWWLKSPLHHLLNFNIIFTLKTNGYSIIYKIYPFKTLMWWQKLDNLQSPYHPSNTSHYSVELLTQSSSPGGGGNHPHDHHSPSFLLIDCQILTWWSNYNNQWGTHFGLSNFNMTGTMITKSAINHNPVMINILAHLCPFVTIDWIHDSYTEL